MTDELLPCPHCGAIAQVVEGQGPFEGRAQVECSACRISTFWYDEAVVRNQWNRRALRSASQPAAQGEPVAYLSTDPKQWGGSRIKPQGTFTIPVYLHPAAPAQSGERVAEIVASHFVQGGIAVKLLDQTLPVGAQLYAAPQSSQPVEAGETVDYDRVVSICDAHGIGLPVDCVEMVVEIIRHTVPQPTRTEQSKAAVATTLTTTAYPEEANWIEAVMTLADDERLDGEASSESKAECRAELRRLLNTRPNRMPNYPHPSAVVLDDERVAIALTDKQILNICKMYEVFGDLDIEFIYLGHAIIMANDRARRSCDVAQSVEQTAQADFKNFHRLLCERFGYVHDEQDWQRDQLSLIEWIASRAASPQATATPYDGLTEEFTEEVARLANDAPGIREAVAGALASCSAQIEPQATATQPAQTARAERELTNEKFEDLQEAREILENMVRSVELDGNYSTEATCTFLRQALQCLPAAQPASGGDDHASN